MEQGLGTQLRHLLDLLDPAVQCGYREAGLDYRPRYTPVMQVLAERGEATIGAIARAAGISQPAVTQTVALMVADDLVRSEPDPTDARTRVVRLSDRGRDLLGTLREFWAVTEAAARSLDDELPMPLSTLLTEAIRRLEARPFADRLAAARADRADRADRESGMETTDAN